MLNINELKQKHLITKYVIFIGNDYKFYMRFIKYFQNYSYKRENNIFYVSIKKDVDIDEMFKDVYLYINFLKNLVR